MNCVFCAIANNQIKSFKIYEDSDITAVLDIFPANPGHIIIFPKKHIERFEEVPDNIIGKIFVLSKYLSNILKKALGAEGINLFLSSGEIAGQRSKHIIIHLIPRYRNDDLKFEWNRKQIDEKTLLDIQNKILKYLNIEQINSNKKQEKIEEYKESKEDEEKYKKMLYWFKRKI